MIDPSHAISRVCHDSGVPERTFSPSNHDAQRELEPLHREIDQARRESERLREDTDRLRADNARLKRERDELRREVEGLTRALEAVRRAGKRWAAPTYDALCEQIRGSPVLNPNGTRWKGGGRLWWLRVLATAHRRPRRSKRAPVRRRGAGVRRRLRRRARARRLGALSSVRSCGASDLSLASHPTMPRAR